MTRFSRLLFATAATLAVPLSTALAQGEGEAPPEPAPEATGEATGEAPPPPIGMGETPSAPTGGPSAGYLTLWKGKILIAGSTLNIGLSDGAVGEPVSLAPNLWYGVTDKLTMGLIHDSGTTQWTPRPAFRMVTIDIPPLPPVIGAVGSGICFTGEDGGCPEFYDNVGLDALFSLMADQFSLAVHGGLDFFSISEGTFQLRTGVLGRYAATDKISIAFDPRLTFPLSDRDVLGDSIDVPLWVWFQATSTLAAYVHTGIAGSFEDFGDTFLVPLGIGASFQVNQQLTLGADLHFLNLLGNDGDADARMLGLRAAYAL